MEKVGLISVVFNIAFAAVKLMAGFFGRSYGLIADGIESLADVFSSLIVWYGLRFSEKEADAEHPYGHGKAESLAAFVASISLLISGGLIGYHASRELFSPQESPSVFTLPVVILVIVGKELLYRYMKRKSDEYGSAAIAVDAWHHRLDSMTTLAVLIGLLVALIGGERWANADRFAALFIACFIIYNAFRLVRPAMDALLDRDATVETKRRIVAICETVEGVQRIESVRAMKSGTRYVVDIHLEVSGDLSVSQGHAIAHRVKDELLRREEMRITHVMTHVEPYARDAGER